MQYKIRKPLKRIYDLLILLIDAPKPLSKQEVAREIKCSRPTLDSTIEDANYLMDAIGTIKFTDEGLVLEKESELNKRHIRSIISNETFITQFLFDLLFSRIHSIEEWAYERYLSPSTAYKYIRDIEGYLAHFEIELVNSKDHWQLKGNDWQIRYLFLQILKEKSVTSSEWMFPDYDKDVILTFVQELMEEMDVYASPMVEYQYQLIVGVHLAMINNNNMIESTNKEKMKFFRAHHDFTKIFAHLEEGLQLSLSNYDKDMMIGSLELFTVNYLSQETLNRRLKFSRETDKDVYELATEVFTYFGNGKDTFVHYLDIFSPLQLVKYFQDVSFADIDEIVDTTFFSCVGEIFSKKVENFDRFILDKPYSSYYFDNRSYIIKRLYIIYEQETELPPKKPIETTILSQFGLQQEAHYKKIIEEHFPQHTFTFVNSRYVHENNLWSELDLVISDFTFAHHVAFYNIFYIEDWLNTVVLKKLEVKVEQTRKNF